MKFKNAIALDPYSEHIYTESIAAELIAKPFICNNSKANVIFSQRYNIS